MRAVQVCYGGADGGVASPLVGVFLPPWGEPEGAFADNDPIVVRCCKKIKGPGTSTLAPNNKRSPRLLCYCSSKAMGL